MNCELLYAPVSAGAAVVELLRSLGDNVSRRWNAVPICPGANSEDRPSSQLTPILRHYLQRHTPHGTTIFIGSDTVELCADTIINALKVNSYINLVISQYGHHHSALYQVCEDGKAVMYPSSDGG